MEKEKKAGENFKNSKERGQVEKGKKEKKWLICKRQFCPKALSRGSKESIYWFRRVKRKYLEGF